VISISPIGLSLVPTFYNVWYRATSLGNQYWLADEVRTLQKGKTTEMWTEMFSKVIFAILEFFIEGPGIPIVLLIVTITVLAAYIRINQMKQ